MGDSGFYTLPEAARIAKVPRTTVAYWDKTELVPASHRRGRLRLYSFADLRDLQVAEQLRGKGARVKAIRAALAYVRKSDNIERLARAGFGVTNAGELIHDLSEDQKRGAHPDRGGQVFWVDLRGALDTLGATAGEVEELNPHDRVKINPRVRGGAPVIAGTRIPTRLIAELRAEGASIGEILADYPTLTTADVKAAESYETGLSPTKRRVASAR